MFIKDNATDINAKNAEPRWITNGENSEEYITNRPLYDINLKHSFIDANEFNYRRELQKDTMTQTGFIDEILIEDLLDFSTKDTLTIKKDFTFNYNGITCLCASGDKIELSRPLELVNDIEIDMVVRKDNLDGPHTAGNYLVLRTNDVSPHSGKIYTIMRDVQIGDLLENIVAARDIIELPESTYQDLVLLKVNDVNITQGDGLVYTNGDKNTPAIVYAEMTDEERVIFYTGTNHIRVQQDEVIQTQYKFVVETRFASGTDFVQESGYIEHATDKGLVQKADEDYIPLFQVQRRNNALYDINANDKGSKQSLSGEWFNRKGDEVPLDAWGLWGSTVTGFVNTNEPVGYYADSTLVQRSRIVDDRDITDFRMYSTKIVDKNAYLAKKIEDNNLRGYSYNKDCTIYDVTISRFDPIAEGHEFYLGAPSYSFNISGRLSLLDLPGKLLGNQKAYLIDDNGINFEIYSIIDTGVFNKIFTVPSANNDVPSFSLPPKIYNLAVLTDSIRPANKELFVNEIFGDINLYPTSTNLSKGCSIELSVDNQKYIITNNSKYDVLLNNTELSVLEFLGIHRTFLGSDTPDNATNLYDGTYRDDDNTVIVPGGGFFVFVNSTNNTKKPMHNWYKNSVSMELNVTNRKENNSHTVEGHKQFIVLNYLYADSLKVIKSNDYGFTWTEVMGLEIENVRNGFILDTEIGYIYNIMYNGILGYKQGYTDIMDRKMLSFTDVQVTNSNVYSNMFMSALAKYPQVQDADTEHLALKVKHDKKSVNFVKHFVVDTNDFDYRSPILKTLGSVYSTQDDKILASVDFEESPFYMFDKEIPNPGAQGNWFGYSIARAKDIKRLVVTAPNGADTSFGIGRGVVFVFDFDEATKTWKLIQTLSNPKTDAAYEKFGTAITISDNGLLITAGQGSTYTPNYNSISTFEHDGAEFVIWAEILDKEVKSQLTNKYLFGNADDSILPWDGIGSSVKIVGNDKIIVGIPGYNGDSNGIILNNIGRVVIFQRENNQWNESPSGLNTLRYIDGLEENKNFGTSMTYNGTLFVGSTSAEVISFDISDLDNIVANTEITLGKLSADPINTDRLIDYTGITVSESGEYFIYTKGRDLHIKQYRKGLYKVFKEYTRNEDVVVPEMINTNSTYIDENDVIIVGYYGAEPVLVNSFTSIGGESKCIYYQPNKLDTDLYDYFNDENIEDEVVFVRGTDKLEIITQHNQNFLKRTGSLQIDLKHFIK